MVAGRRDIAQQDGLFAEARDHYVDTAIVIEIAEGGAAVEGGGSGRRGVERAAGALRQNEAALAGGIGIFVEIAIDGEQIFAAIVVEIENAAAPSGGGQRGCAHARTVGEIARRGSLPRIGDREGRSRGRWR